jgi:hypothetical protein
VRGVLRIVRGGTGEGGGGIKKENEMKEESRESVVGRWNVVESR